MEKRSTVQHETNVVRELWSEEEEAGCWPEALNPSPELAVRITKHVGFFLCLLDGTSAELRQAAVNLARETGNPEALACYFLQILDYALEARGSNPDPVLRAVARSLQFRLDLGAW